MPPEELVRSGWGEDCLGFSAAPPANRTWISGTSCYSSRQFMLSVDGKVVNDQIHTFISAICFDIHYPVGLGSTLEFLQRTARSDVPCPSRISDQTMDLLLQAERTPPTQKAFISLLGLILHPRRDEREANEYRGGNLVLL
ncbi:hypothetical protein L3Q82_019332 [Scortum barcoo]|uniref:Uncharacterized protein n=1 Tax=Scortum barcoo TaxID=214431 RepID=A0ACB8VDY5_9TELE|nr:hypothetical protein L3Q82_019332 [Scortum barcoo]